MNNDAWHLDQSDGRLLVRTGVEGPAAKMGHRLTIAMTEWQATVDWTDGELVAVTLTVEVGSLKVVDGEGGVTPLSAPEKLVARANALKTLNAKKYPRITFEGNQIEKTPDGYRLIGDVQIHGRTRECGVDVTVARRDVSCEVPVRHSDFGVKPYSMLMGAMKVADEVTVSFEAQNLQIPA